MYTDRMNSKGRKLNGEFFDPMYGYVCAENAQPLPDNLKKMIETVREAFPSIGRDKIAMVLQSCDYSLDKTLSSLSKDGGEDLLGDWSTQGRKGKGGAMTNKSKRKRKNKKTAATSREEVNGDTQSNNHLAAITNTEKMNGRLSDSLDGLDASSQVSEKDTILPNSDSGVVAGSECSSRKSSLSIPSTPEIFSQLKNTVTALQTVANSSTTEATTTTNLSKDTPSMSNDDVRHKDTESKKKASAKETMRRSVKDLQRSAVSIARFHLVLDEECKLAEKKIKMGFEEIKKCVMDRERILTEELEALRTSAAEKLEQRQEDAAMLKLRCDRIGGMTEAQLTELRADIKHFVGDRKVDEEIAKTSRYVGDHECLVRIISEFGKVTPIKTAYKTRSSASISSSVSTVDDRILSRATSTVTDDVFNNGVPEDVGTNAEPAATVNGNQPPSPTGKGNMKPLSANELRERADVHNKLKEALQHQDIPQQPNKERTDRNRSGSDRNRPRTAHDEKRNDQHVSTYTSQSRQSVNRHHNKHFGKPWNNDRSKDMNGVTGSSEKIEQSYDRGSGKSRSFRRTDRHRPHDGKFRDRSRRDDDRGYGQSFDKRNAVNNSTTNGKSQVVVSSREEALVKEEERRRIPKEQLPPKEPIKGKDVHLNGDVDINCNVIERVSNESQRHDRKYDPLPQRKRGGGFAKRKDHGHRSSEKTNSPPWGGPKVGGNHSPETIGAGNGENPRGSSVENVNGYC